MSEVLRQFVDPCWHIPDDEESMRKLITTALVAWNAALLPEAERAAYLGENDRSTAGGNSRRFLRHCW